MRKATRVIKASEIKAHYSMQKAIDAMEVAFASLSSGESRVPLRYVSKLPSNGMLMLFKPAYVEKERRASIKILTQRESGTLQDIPTIQGLVLLLDTESGEILSMLDGTYITALRTGAASGLATRHFAPKDAQVMALFGCGAQGRSQLEAVLCERDIQRLFVFEKDKDTAEDFIREMKKTFHVDMQYTENNSALGEVDIICTATNSCRALFSREDVKEGVHINAIGSFQPAMQELDPLLLQDARIFVDNAESCLKESGDLIKPISAGLFSENHIAGEIGEFLMNRIDGRGSDKEITVFKSVGVAIQDLVVASDIYNIALQEGIGEDIKLFE